MKAFYHNRIYADDQRHLGRSKLFGCYRVVWNDALALVKSTPEGKTWPSHAESQKICITQAKQTEGRDWLATEHDRDINASANILATGQSDPNGHVLSRIGPPFGSVARLSTQQESAWCGQPGKPRASRPRRISKDHPRNDAILAQTPWGVGCVIL